MSVKKVETFDLENSLDKDLYIKLMNNPEVKILREKENFSVKENSLKVVVWYIDDGDD